MPELTNDELHELAQKWVEKVQSDRPCRFCETPDFTVIKAEPNSPTTTLITAVCGNCEAPQAGIVLTEKLLCL